MPTPFEPAQRGEWAARTDTPRRSVFANYRAEDADHGKQQPVPCESQGRPSSVAPGESGMIDPAIDIAVARSFIHRFLALAFADPTEESWRWLNDTPTIASLQTAAEAISPGLSASAAELIASMNPGAFGAFLDSHFATFGHAARGSCPLNEIEYGDIKADPLFQPHRLADLAGFYRAFGLEVAGEAGERHDHICLELEFLCVLAAKEAYALRQRSDDDAELCRDAQKKFLREHLGRWTPAFARRLASATNDPILRALAEFTRAFVESECASFAVSPGSEDLRLRPVDEAADRMCDSCGLASLPPGAEPIGTIG